MLEQNRVVNEPAGTLAADIESTSSAGWIACCARCRWMHGTAVVDGAWAV
jgi:hypothetical protein